MLHVIHLPNDPLYQHREEREKSFKKQFLEQGITNYKVWDGIYNPNNTIKAISQAHKKIIKYAKDNNLPNIFVAEDDIRFTRPGAWDYFIKNVPDDCDMFLGHVYYGKWDDKGKLIGPFASMTLYCVNSKFYDYFLSVSEIEHIDLMMNAAYRYDIRVCLPMVCGQNDGWSDNSKDFRDWSQREKDKPMF